MHQFIQILTTRRANKLTMLAILLAWMASQAVAAPMVGYQLRMASDKRLLLAPNNPNVRMLVSKKTKYDRMIERRMPYFELINTSEEASLDNWEFSIGQVENNFQNIEILDAPTSGLGASSVQATLQETLPLATPSANLLSMNFEGLTPGQSVIGRITLAPDDPGVMGIPDFRNVFFQLGSPELPEVTNNATIRTSFSDGTTLEGMLPNFLHAEAAIGPALIPCSNDSFLEQEVYEYGQQGESTAVVPEPGAFLLALLGLACLLGRNLVRRIGCR